MKFLVPAFSIPIVAAALLVVSPVSGQEAGSALKGHDTDAPVDVAADRIEVQDRADRAIFSGNVEVRQGSLRLSSARLTVAYSSTGGIEIRRLEASGGVTLRSPSETARSEFAIYDLDQRLVTMIGGVTLTRGASHVEGGRLVLDLDTGRAVMDGGGAGAPGTQATGGRVTGRFTVPRRPNG
ncbi:MAG TPA: LptA/OstA family protein [Allosphingosinicella sp.]|nr:LptA/OstA family protein [Allosphingosinicella sp.]